VRKLFYLIKNMVSKVTRVFNKEVALKVYYWGRRLLSFVFLLVVYLLTKISVRVLSFKFIPRAISNPLHAKIDAFYTKVVFPTRRVESSLNRVNLIELSFKNMGYKMTRTVITIGGMSVGIAAIVFLVSVGYGLQELVTSRVARLEEMRQLDVSVQPGSNVKITDDTLSTFGETPNVKHVLPLVALVGKINYKNSITDVAVYGVTTEYLKQSAIKPVKGTVFESDDIFSSFDIQKARPAVAGLSTIAPVIGATIRDVEVSLYPSEWIRVRESPNVDGFVLGYTKRMGSFQSGVEVWGSEYPDNENGRAAKDAVGNRVGKWVHMPVFIWEKNGDEYVPMMDDEGHQLHEEAYMAEVNMSVISNEIIEPAVLGLMDTVEESDESTESTESAGIVDLGDGWVILEGEGIGSEETQTTVVALQESALRKAVVNRSLLSILGIEEGDALGQTFDISIIVTSGLLENPEEKIESELTEYEIIGVVPEENTPFIYVPFSDVKGLGVYNYSGIKVVVDTQKHLPEVRQRIESAGFITASVVDTVEQINTLFSTLRKVLALIGAVALAVASLGMFNTLTVSLLERTREIGLMKAMGMKSYEVQELFLTESMVMGFFGGFFGILSGFVAGKLLGLLLSLVAVFKGVGYIDVAYLPMPFVLLILILSLIVGLATGIYPARRATRISALNALRYE
jgi:ABC-type antimicrobial peptide transport system permease subunit